MTTVQIARRDSFAGLFMITLATLMYEILLTRIFSATVFYHFAFVALSIALFGMTVGALLVYLLPERFVPEDVHRQLAVYSLAFSVSILASFLLHLAIPLVLSSPVAAVLTVATKYLVISLPFVFSGICVCLALTRFPTQVSRLYAADMVGSSIGCMVVLATLKFMDAPTAVVLVAVLAAVGAGFFAAEVNGRMLRRWSFMFAAACLLLAMVNTGMARAGSPLLRLRWVKFAREGELLHERWNSFSRITVEGKEEKPLEPFGWGLSATYPKGYEIPQLKLTIDGLAGTVLTKFDGNFSSVDYLRFDVTNIAHSVRPNARVLVVGVGGGRDILSALYFNQKSVTGVELNHDTLNTINDRFGDFTGHLDQDPRVNFVNDEARAYVARQTDKFDIIMASLTDTWAATAAGAFVLSENNLYTVEAFDTFLGHLNPGGVLSVSRWYQKGLPAEAYRLTALAMQALRERGVKDPQKHIFLATQLRKREPNWMMDGDIPEGVGTSTILVSNQPFTTADIARFEKITKEMDFEVTLSPVSSPDSVLANMAKAEDLDAFSKTYPLDISPPHDDRPFFFYLFRVGDLASWSTEQGMNDPNRLAMLTLALLLGVVFFLTGVCIVLPLWLSARRGALKGSLPLVLFFGCIGFGFMTLEIAQMQRLNIFLGHPTYGLSVVLFSLLLSSGLGSFTTQKVTVREGITRLMWLLIVLLAVGLATPLLTRALEPTPLPVHILVSVLLLFPMGLFLGMAFPLGMKAAQERASELAPWFWGINGATSVCASVLAIIVAINFGVTVTFWTGTAFYVIALLAYLRRVTPVGAAA